MALASCADTVSLVPGLPGVPVPDVMRVVKDTDRPANVIERGLSHCDRRIAAGEAACVRQRLVDENVTIAGLIAMIPGCQAGRTCDYSYTTVDRVGFVPATSSDYVVHWRAAFKFLKPVAKIGDVPITVVPM